MESIRLFKSIAYIILAEEIEWGDRSSKENGFVEGSKVVFRGFGHRLSNININITTHSYNNEEHNKKQKQSIVSK